MFHASTKDLELDAPYDADAGAKRVLPTLSEDLVLPSPTNEESKSTKSSDVGFDMEAVLMEVDMKNQENTSVASNDASFNEQFPERKKQYREPGNDAAIVTDHVPIPKSIDMTVTDDASVANHESAEVTMEEQIHGEADAEILHPTLVPSISGKSRPKWRTFNGAVLFPSKPLLSPIAFKKKTKKSKSRVKMLSL